LFLHFIGLSKCHSNLTPFSYNVLHGRSAFRDAGAGRLLYRARFHERIAGS
jgi:hypothetical protein